MTGPAEATGQDTWQVWECCQLIGSGLSRARAERLHAELLDQARHDWPHLGHLAADCVGITRAHPDLRARP